jgi:single-strand selective monofunctional uracil DNA glycosylase
MVINELILAAENLRDEVEPLGNLLVENGLVDYSYNPLIYAWEPHKAFIELGGSKGAKTLLLGMNPGPHGMGQMGIPFSATSVVRDLLGIKDLQVLQPKKIHPKRPVTGLDWHKEEISGTRIWSILEECYGSLEEIFSNIFIVNHCPLMLFTGERGTNITPDRISGEIVKELLEKCDEHLVQVVEIMGIERVIGVGKYAEKRAKKALEHLDVEIVTCWHPSPASPLANRNKGRDWKENIKNVLPKK